VRATEVMIDSAATEPAKAQKRLEKPMKGKTTHAANELETLREKAAGCRACPL
jgi:DNA polymerase